MALILTCDGCFRRMGYLEPHDVHVDLYLCMNCARTFKPSQQSTTTIAFSLVEVLNKCNHPVHKTLYAEILDKGWKYRESTTWSSLWQGTRVNDAIDVFEDAHRYLIVFSTLWTCRVKINGDYAPYYQGNYSIAQQHTIPEAI